MRTAGVALITSFALALSGGVAVAQDGPSERGYSERLGVIGEIESVEPTPTPTTPAPAPSPAPQPAAPVQATANEGDLPFTGLDLGIILGMGVVLLGTGLVLRRTAARGDHTA